MDPPFKYFFFPAPLLAVLTTKAPEIPPLPLPYLGIRDSTQLSLGTFQPGTPDIILLPKLE